MIYLNKLGSYNKFIYLNYMQYALSTIVFYILEQISVYLSN